MGKGDKKSKRGKIIIGSFGVRRPKNKRKAVMPVTEHKVAEKPKKSPKTEVVETPELAAEAVVQSTVEVKKPAKKTTAKKTTEGEAETPKPKAAKPKKKTAAEGDNLFTQNEPEPEAEK
jgi:30S ribosomal protein S31